MNFPNERSTKVEMLIYAKSKGLSTVRKLAKRINCNPLADYEICEIGSVDDILCEIKDNNKGIIWSELIRLCPELILPDDDEQDEEFEEESSDYDEVESECEESDEYE